MSKDRNESGQWLPGVSGSSVAAKKKPGRGVFQKHMRRLSQAQCAAFLEDQVTYKTRRQLERVYERDAETGEEVLKRERITETEDYGKYAMDAVREINNRGWGKAPQVVHLEDEDGESTEAGISERLRAKIDEQLLGITPEIRAEANREHAPEGEIH